MRTALFPVAMVSLFACSSGGSTTVRGGPDNTTPTSGEPTTTPTGLPATPTGLAVRVPAEWEPQEAIWLQWPRIYEQMYEPAFAQMVSIMIRYEDVHILVHNGATKTSAEDAMLAAGMDSAVIDGADSPEGFAITWHSIPNDSAWMRDNGPRYVLVDDELRIQNWEFDAWGGAFGPFVTYNLDNAVPDAVGDFLGMPVDQVSIVHERGDLEFNGTDAVILNWTVIGDPNRNPGLTRDQVVAAMEEHFGVTRTVLIEGAPAGDLTGGHVDGIARFIDNNRVVVADCSATSACAPGGADDQIYDGAAALLEAEGFEVLRFPFEAAVPYRDAVFDTDYMNWLVGNGFVITVGFDSPTADANAKAQLEAWFPGRDVYVVQMLESWYNGGGVHCHTNDQPRAP